MKTPQSSARDCFVCGVNNPFGLHIQFFEAKPGEVEADFSIPETFQGYPGIVHGGVVAAILDEAAGRSHMGTGKQPRFMFTAKLEIRYRKNVPVCQWLRLVGNAGLSKARTASATSAIYNQLGELLAEAEAVLVNIPEAAVPDVDLDALGWKVYPET
jgi:acyl-coenzyme A thioesterase PaaI-like protein